MCRHAPWGGRLMFRILAITLAAMLAAGPGRAQAPWQPTKPIEFIVTSGPGGGTDAFARTIQASVTKYKLIEQPIVVLNKGGGSGAEGYVCGKASAADPSKVTFGTNNEYLLPLVAKLAWKGEDFAPVAAMVLDEFILWTTAKSDFKDAKSYVEAAKAKPNTYKMGGSQSKDTDQTLTGLIETNTGSKFIYVPFKSGSEAAVQLAGGHVDSNTNNPSENIVAGLVKPLCVFSPTRLPAGPKVTPTWDGRTFPPARTKAFRLSNTSSPAPSGCPPKRPRRRSPSIRRC